MRSSSFPTKTSKFLDFQFLQLQKQLILNMMFNMKFALMTL